MKRLIILSLIVLAIDASAHLRVGVNLHVGAPPPCRSEVIPVRPNRHAVWVPGYWSFDPRLRDYIWIAGGWQRPPHRHAVWVPPTYHQRGYGYKCSPGYWR